MWSQETILELKQELENHYECSTTLIRQGPSLLFRANNLALRLSNPEDKHLDHLQKEAQLINWLADQGIRTIELVADPHLVSKHPVLAYRWIESESRPVLWKEFGSLVKRLHDIKAPAWLDPYSFPHPYKSRAKDLHRTGLLSEQELDCILALGDSGLTACHKNDQAPESLLHGDLHTGNLLFDKDREELVLIDWEDAARGPVDIDFSSILQRPRFFSLSPRDFALFQEGYGKNLASSSLAEAMINLRIANSITHLLLGGEKRRDEGRRRLRDVLSSGWSSTDALVAWRDA